MAVHTMVVEEDGLEVKEDEEVAEELVDNVHGVGGEQATSHQGDPEEDEELPLEDHIGQEGPPGAGTRGAGCRRGSRPIPGEAIHRSNMKTRSAAGSRQSGSVFLILPNTHKFSIECTLQALNSYHLLKMSKSRGRVGGSASRTRCPVHCVRGAGAGIKWWLSFRLH